MKECFREKKFNEKSLGLIERCDSIIEEYAGRGMRLTLRQLYYVLVSSDVIPNNIRSYKNLGGLVSDARIAGLLDWDGIEDRVRVPDKPQQFDSMGDLMDVALRAYRLPRWEGQENYVELWVEKDALANVLRPVAKRDHVTLMVNRGYSSSSAMYEAAQRFTENGSDGQNLIILYLGDHDPSGEDMVRDVRDRLALFGADVDVRKIALTMAQVEEYDPPPNPAKVTDSRAAAYIRRYGDKSWELDALKPEVLQAIITDEIDPLIDRSLMDAIIERETREKKTIEKAVASLRGK